MLYRVHSIYGQKKTVGWTPNTTFEMDLRASNIGKGDASDATPGASPEASPAS